MTQPEFESQMNRLAECYGKTAYGMERTRLIFNEVKSLSSQWMSKVVSDFIGSSRQAPLVKDFQEGATKERERLWDIEKKQERSESINSKNYKFGDDERAGIFEAVNARLIGKLNDSAFESFHKGIGKLSWASCNYCDQVGYVFLKNESGNDYPHACVCEAGSKKPNKFPRATINQIQRGTL